MADVRQSNVLPLVPGALKSAPAFYTNYILCTVSTLDVQLVFCQRVQDEGTDKGSEEHEQALPTDVCYMSHAQFYSFAKMIGNQAGRLKEELSKAKAVVEQENTGG